MPFKDSGLMGCAVQTILRLVSVYAQLPNFAGRYIFAQWPGPDMLPVNIKGIFQRHLRK